MNAIDLKFLVSNANISNDKQYASMNKYRNKEFFAIITPTAEKIIIE